ncbi:hypothetical protein SAMN05421854_11497 [Amycolatopsis rubida]|uniref:Uncharacterized protein n=1 Tax=Amycolatopsis rubida TaxID=112413 RepID=A0A1I5Z8Y9_9PSEU|nr:hypothetical protein SAMN05421854_11497 [Amycolatopsis rubida]
MPPPKPAGPSCSPGQHAVCTGFPATGRVVH